MLANLLDEMLAALAQPAAQPTEPAGEPVAAFREDDDIGHIDLLPYQGPMLKDGDKLFTRPAVQQEPVVAELVAALMTARDHIPMDALDISHCKDAQQIRSAIAKNGGTP
jgi:hypothetical protein